MFLIMYSVLDRTMNTTITTLAQNQNITCEYQYTEMYKRLGLIHKLSEKIVQANTIKKAFNH